MGHIQNMLHALVFYNYGSDMLEIIAGCKLEYSSQRQQMCYALASVNVKLENLHVAMIFKYHLREHFMSIASANVLKI